MRLNTKLLMRMRKQLKETKFRWPIMEGRTLGSKVKPLHWSDTDFGQLEEEVNYFGHMIPARDRVPIIMVPDLTDCELKPYVTYLAENEYEPPLEAKDLFNAFYAPKIEAEAENVPLETIPEK